MNSAFFLLLLIQLLNIDCQNNAYPAITPSKPTVVCIQNAGCTLNFGTQSTVLFAPNSFKLPSVDIRNIAVRSPVYEFDSSNPAYKNDIDNDAYKGNKTYLTGSTYYYCADGISECESSCCNYGECTATATKCQKADNDVRLIILIVSLVYTMIVLLYWLAYSFWGIFYVKKVKRRQKKEQLPDRAYSNKGLMMNTMSPPVKADTESNNKDDISEDHTQDKEHQKLDIVISNRIPRTQRKRPFVRMQNSLKPENDKVDDVLTLSSLRKFKALSSRRTLLSDIPSRAPGQETIAERLEKQDNVITNASHEDEFEARILNE